MLCRTPRLTEGEHRTTVVMKYQPLTVSKKIYLPMLGKQGCLPKHTPSIEALFLLFAANALVSQKSRSTNLHLPSQTNNNDRQHVVRTNHVCFFPFLNGVGVPSYSYSIVRNNCPIQSYHGLENDLAPPNR